MIRPLLLASLIMFTQTGCEERSKTELAEVHWDRDMCARCVMVVSDRQNTVQVKNPTTGESYMFDDLGCAVLWFKENKIEWKDKAMIWITDLESGEWIDARTAFYDAGNVTPMAFGFSAHKTKEAIQKGKEVLSFGIVSQKIFEIKMKKMREKKMH